MTFQYPEYCIGAEVVTESNDRLGWVRQFVWKPEYSKPVSLILSPLRALWLPAKLTGAYGLDCDGIYTVGPDDRIIVADYITVELTHLTVGWLEQFEWTKPTWKKSKLRDSILPHSSELPPREDEDDDDRGYSPNPSPRRPNPGPLTHQAEMDLLHPTENRLKSVAKNLPNLLQLV